jgi:hypothetical protein
MFSYLIHGEQVEICGNKLKYFFISMYFNILHYFEIDKVKIYRTIIIIDR